MELTLSKRFLTGYYYTFEPTGDDKIDAILEALAIASRAFHSTEFWEEASELGENGYWGFIQQRANEAAR